MSTFYILPPRIILGQQVAGLLKSLFPRLTWEASTWDDLAELAGEAIGLQSDAYVVFKEEIPDGEAVGSVLREVYGAEPGDAIVELGGVPFPHRPTAA